MELQIHKTEKVKVKEGIYEAVFAEIKDIPPKDERDRVVLSFDSKIEGKVVRLPFFANKYVSNTSKLGKTLEALGLNLESEKVNIKDFIGKPCRIIVLNYKDKEGDMVSGVDKILELELLKED